MSRTYRESLTKSDGRNLWLYGRAPIALQGERAPSPSPDKVDARPHLRYHPLRGEWVIYAGHRQNRTFLPPPEYNPLAPTSSAPGATPTELPSGNYEVAVFENRFPSLTLSAPAPTPLDGVEMRAGLGACEVVVFTQDAQASLASLPVDRIELILEVWGERTDALYSKSAIQYVMPFENKGVECGVTLHHPHSQIYAYSEIPPVAERLLQNQWAYFEKNKRGLLEDVIAAEKARVLWEESHALAWVPAFARYPFETWVAPRRRVSVLSELRVEERRELAVALKATLLRFDRMWDRSFPYLMILYQGTPKDPRGKAAHLHFEFFPPYRSKDRLKFLAGTEIGAGVFANDALPEATAELLRAVPLTRKEVTG